MLLYLFVVRFYLYEKIACILCEYFSNQHILCFSTPQLFLSSSFVIVFVDLVTVKNGNLHRLQLLLIAHHLPTRHSYIHANILTNVNKQFTARYLPPKNSCLTELQTPYNMPHLPSHLTSIYHYAVCASVLVFTYIPQQQQETANFFFCLLSIFSLYRL